MSQAEKVPNSLQSPLDEMYAALSQSQPHGKARLIKNSPLFREVIDIYDVEAVEELMEFGGPYEWHREVQTDTFDPQQLYYDKVDTLRRNIDTAEDPEAAVSAIHAWNGYKFVIEPATDGSVMGYIPARSFTEHFSKRQIPIAPPGSTLYDHDLGHIPDYQDMFGVKLFADTVALAARNALAGDDESRIEERCTTFTEAIDRFSDMRLSLASELYRSRMVDTYFVNQARQHLATLVELAYGANPLETHPDRTTPRVSTADSAFLQLYHQLGIERFRQAALPGGAYSLRQARASELLGELTLGPLDSDQSRDE